MRLIGKKLEIQISFMYFWTESGQKNYEHFLFESFINNFFLRLNGLDGATFSHFK